MRRTPNTIDKLSNRQWARILLIVWFALFFLWVFGGAAVKGAGPEPPQAPPVKREKYDPYRFRDYADLIESIKLGGRGMLAVGVKDPHVGTYHRHLAVPAGFKGLANGVYECFLDEATRQPMMTLVKTVAAREVRPAPFIMPRPERPDRPVRQAGHTIQTTNATPAVGQTIRHTLSGAGTARGTSTGARVVTSGSTNGCTSFG